MLDDAIPKQDAVMPLREERIGDVGVWAWLYRW